VISLSQGRYLHTGQHKHRINTHNTDIHALSGIRTHDPNLQASEDGSCLQQRGHCDRPYPVDTGDISSGAKWPECKADLSRLTLVDILHGFILTLFNTEI
jgi:hypothetical protein